MAQYLTRRVLYGILTVALVILLTFVIQYLMPGDPARSIAGPKASPELLASIRARLHLDDPLPLQLWNYFSSVLHGDLGESYTRNRPVLDLILERLPATAMLAAAALMIEVVLGASLGLWEAMRQTRSWPLAALNVALLSIPAFALGFLLLLCFGYLLPVFPVDGGTGWSHLVLPAVTLGVLGAPYYANLVRDGMNDALAAPYTRTAVAKGLPKRYIVSRHVLRNALPPSITMVGMDVAIMFSGIVFVEAIFGWPGIGALQTQAFADVDRPVLMGTVIVAAVVVVLGNLAADVMRAIVDPRTKVGAL
ncbi:ABC-type dipeptide/oligopeptide/nickel transport system permease component [Mycobacterium frederiksbergense]|uniref:ABC-type dipeptide/oligopeptide/nickel transport system permease component n=1 Tax=Mycolicibacterium frederiksbergense TaxID=117567 RepID=A0ABT6L7G9_9MYCO|nr:ABC transporter permease [Mycolicibacterium frederiksbergense]MDH6198182.1 ABC-type dipeptide/oligopeptide/nickel transport system permease component [Mycolicibacterium frederiksbergense]